MVQLGESKYKVVYSNRAEKKLKKIDRQYQEKIREKVESLNKNLYSNRKDKFLKGREWEGCHSFRVWPYRIIYQILKEKLIISIRDIDHRKDAYRN